jgi:hypothetical protein
VERIYREVVLILYELRWMGLVEEKSWEEFRESGLLWWINMILHTFGWAIVIEVYEGEVTKAYPARVRFRGFDEKNNSEGYQKVSKYLNDNANELCKESYE